MPLGVEVPAAGYERNAVTADQGAEGEGLRVDAVTVRFGGLTALDDVSLTVSPGEVVGVIGPNGAGKTTLFNVICGFVRPDDGRRRVARRGRCAPSGRISSPAWASPAPCRASGCSPG